MKKLLYSLLILSSFQACQFEGLNIDPNTLQEVDVSAILPVAIAQTAYNANTLNARAAGVWVQQYSGLSLQEADLENYKLTPSVVNDAWNQGFFAGSLRDCNLIIEQATAQSRPIYQGIGKVLMAYNLGMATVLWGDIPYSEAFKGGENTTPSYDAQESIYQVIESLLAESIQDLSATPNSNFPRPSSDDYLYSGAAEQWIKFANSLAFRFAMHQVKRGEAAAISKAEAAIDRGIIEVPADEPVFSFGSTINDGHPIAVFNTRQQGRLIGNSGFAARLNENNDPRLSSYMIEEESGNYAIYQPVASGQLFWGVYNSFYPFIALEEVVFLQAELEARQNDSEAASAFLEKALSLNMTKLGLDGAEYIAANNTLEGTKEENIAKIIGEKYVALYGQSPIEVWTDYRRTGYPELSPVDADSPQNPSGIIPLRIPYPITEQVVNATNYQAAIQRQGNGQGLLDDTMWLFE